MFAQVTWVWCVCDLVLNKATLKGEVLSALFTTESSRFGVAVHMFVQGCLGFKIFSTCRAGNNTMAIFVMLVEAAHTIARKGT